VHAGHEVAPGPEHVEDGLTHPGHDAHVHGDVRRVGELHTDVRDGRPERTHRERHDVHRPPPHRARVQLEQLGLHLGRRPPVVGGASVGLAHRADEGAILDPGDIARIRHGQKAVGALRVVEAGERAAVDQQRREAIPLLVRAVAPLDLVGLQH